MNKPVEGHVATENDGLGGVGAEGDELPRPNARLGHVPGRPKHNDSLLRHRWLLIVLLVFLAALAWVTRYEVGDCNDYGCLVFDRWTGHLTYRSVMAPN